MTEQDDSPASHHKPDENTRGEDLEERVTENFCEAIRNIEDHQSRIVLRPNKAEIGAQADHICDSNNSLVNTAYRVQ